MCSIALHDSGLVQLLLICFYLISFSEMKIRPLKIESNYVRSVGGPEAVNLKSLRTSRKEQVGIVRLSKNPQRHDTNHM